MKDTEKSKRLDGELYINTDPLLLKEHKKAMELSYEYNSLPPSKEKKRRKILKHLLGTTPEDLCIEQPFRCDFGYNIHLGNHFYSNYNLTILDCSTVTIGDNCLIGPNVSIITVNHAEDRQQRINNLEYARPITIGDDVWLGCGVIINPGVTIGDNVIIGSGSVVTKDIPSNSLAVGIPARVIRQI